MKTVTASLTILVATTIIALSAYAAPFGDFGKWVNKEAIPTLTGERPLKIKPYVSVKDDKVEFRVGPNDLKVRVGNVQIQTHQLALRLAQAGCVYATGGDVLLCAPDVFQRELLNIADKIDVANPATIPSGALPQYSVPVPQVASFAFQSGTVMQQCGCWGFNPPQIAFEPRCSNTRVVVNVCPGVCSAGGMPYGYTCM